MAVGTYALTTLADLKTWLDITATDTDVALEASIDRATSIIETYCDRKFKSRTHYEFAMPGGGKTLALDNFPVVSIKTVAFGPAVAFSVQSDTASSDVLATVENDGASLKLTKIASDGTETSSSLAFSTYKTTSSLVTQINSSVSGWTASLTSNAYTFSLYRFGGRGVLDAVCLLEYPKDNVSEYRLDIDRALIHMRSDRFPHYDSGSRETNRFPRGFYPVFVEYEAGFATIPHDLERACIEIASELYQTRLQDRLLSSESLGDYNYTKKASASYAEERSHLLDGYRNIR